MSKCIIPWTKAEDDTIINAINSRKGAKTAVFYRLSKSMNRTELAITQRYYVLLKKRSTKPITTKTPKKVKSVETNLEKAIRLYPIGTKVKSIYSNKEDVITCTPRISENPYIIRAKCEILDIALFLDDKWAEIIPIPKQLEIKESPKQKGIFLDESKLQSLSLGFLRELAVTRLVTLDKENLIKLIVE